MLFVCDRTELRDQAHTVFHNVFGNDAQVVTSGHLRKNARILIAAAFLSQAEPARMAQARPEAARTLGLIADTAEAESVRQVGAAVLQSAAD